MEYQASNIDTVEVGYSCTILSNLSLVLNRLVMVADWPNIDVAVMMRSYGRRLLGGRPEKTAVRFIPVKVSLSDDNGLVVRSQSVDKKCHRHLQAQACTLSLQMVAALLFF